MKYALLKCFLVLVNYNKTSNAILSPTSTLHLPCIVLLVKPSITLTFDLPPQNCVLLFKELPLHLWVPEPCDLRLVHTWLVAESLMSFENRLARVILSGLNWGTISEVWVMLCCVNCV